MSDRSHRITMSRLGALMLAVAIGACGGGGGDDSTPPGPTPSTPTPTPTPPPPPSVAPAITTQPSDAAVNVGQTATFSVVATGTAPLAYQWSRNGVAIAGATADTYTTPATTEGDDASRFDVTVTSNAGSSIASSSVTLTVNVAWIGIREDGATYPSLATYPVYTRARAVATDARGNVVIAGGTDIHGEFAGDPVGLKSRGFVAKYSRGGTLLWAHKFPLANPDGLGEAKGVATDAAGNVFVVGHTQGTFAGELHAGGYLDVAVLKYDPAGNLLWAHQFGSASDDYGNAIAVDAAGNAYVVGVAGGQLPDQPPAGGLTFIARFGADGARQWIRQFGGGGGDSGVGVAVDAAGHAYVTGTIQADYGGTSRVGTEMDPFVAKYDSSGSQLWYSRVKAGATGGAPDVANAIAVSADGGAIYVAGRTNSEFDLPGYPAQTLFCCGLGDAFVMRFDGDGTLQWAHNLASNVQTGAVTHFDEGAFGVATDATGSAAYITGYTYGVMPNETSKGAVDIFVARYAGDGTRSWVKQFGSGLPASGQSYENQYDYGYGIALDPRGDLFVAGDTHGTFGTPNPHSNTADWFVMKLKAGDGSAY